MAHILKYTKKDIVLDNPEAVYDKDVRAIYELNKKAASLLKQKEPLYLL